MTGPELEVLLDALAQRYGLRHVEQENRFLGLYDGICIDAWKYDKSLHVYFYSPSIQLTADHILDKRQAFPNLAESPIPLEWVTYRVMHESQLDRQGCLLEVGPEGLSRFSEQELLLIPEIICADLRTHGATLLPPACSLCGGPAGINPVYANKVYQFACKTCFENLRDFAPGGDVQYEVPINMRKAVLTLTLWTVGFTILWGLLQSSEKGVRGEVLFGAPLIASVFICRAVGKAAEGMSLSLRLITVACILLGILAGNIWGFRAAVLRQGDFSLADAIVWYFPAVIADPNGTAWWFFLGGLAGCWVGFGLLKRQNVVNYR